MDEVWLNTPPAALVAGSISVLLAIVQLNRCTDSRFEIAIDRVVHHSVILELTGESYRSEQAKKRNTEAAQASKAAKSSAG